jgi:hypothetical protein
MSVAASAGAVRTSAAAAAKTCKMRIAEITIDHPVRATTKAID